MKRIYLILVLALAASTYAFGTSPEDEILAAEKGWAKAVIARDFVSLEKIYHDGLIYAHSTGTIETKAEYMAKLRSGRQKYTAIEHHKTTIRTQGDGAVAHSIVTMKGTNPAGPFDNKLMMIHTWFKGNGGWQLAAHQTTQIAK
jgi:ketosteroid isomerase-like protein